MARKRITKKAAALSLTLAIAATAAATPAGAMQARGISTHLHSNVIKECVAAAIVLPCRVGDEIFRVDIPSRPR